MRIIAINVNSIITNQRRATLVEFVKKENLDIALLGETKLNPKHVLSFKNYNLIRNDYLKGTQMGGTAILIRNNIKYDTINLKNADKYNVLQLTIVKLELPHNKTLFVIAIYANNKNQNEFLPELNKLFIELKLQNTKNTISLQVILTLNTNCGTVAMVTGEVIYLIHGLKDMILNTG